MTEKEREELRSLMRTYASRIALYQDAVARSLGLSANDMRCFRVLNSVGSMTPGQLARETGFTTGGITKILDRLEKRGAIVRHHETKDRRTITVQVKPSARMAFNGATIDFDQMTTSLLEGYDQQELATIKHFMQSSMDTMARLTSELE
jgi:DNA-binding MarR family transcriptional regulator